ncbi:hypothetical protein A2415_04595 [candidate division WWE3 bacterium RIFOXYC1_FULL_39_7]|uniref:Uncharacterized protein n=1 Tax=candidate division WWE3 bacterium RIFOXYC1_FULL_39_7 TaxID=1802643 RepID=A0A1F4WHC7_UNCKA|nr:MAG: hypothetical protein A2415_04595 [candidate division WWE3 bacterium RIFOXYC1_FULL_39_7]
MAGITITDVKIVGVCSKHRKNNDEILKDINGKIYPDSDIYCIECSFVEKSVANSDICLETENNLTKQHSSENCDNNEYACEICNVPLVHVDRLKKFVNGLPNDRDSIAILNILKYIEEIEKNGYY